MMGTMTHDEAVNQVINLKDKIGRMPTHEDYKKYSYLVNLDDLVKALGIDAAAEERRLGIRPYAAVNIAVLRAMRERQGEVVYIAQANEETVWSSSTSNLFETKYEE